MFRALEPVVGKEIGQFAIIAIIAAKERTVIIIVTIRV